MPAELRGKLPDHVLHSVEMNRNGLISAVVKVDRMLTAFDFLTALREIPFTGLPCVAVRYRVVNGRANVEYAYEGLDAANASFNGDERATYELDVTMSEDPIRTHPNFDGLKEKYGWLPNEGTFPEQMPDSGAGAYAGPQKKAKKNDLHGTDSYLAVGAILRKTYVTQTMPQGILRGIGTVIDRPPGIEFFDLPDASGKRNWLKLAPKIRKRGNCYEITEEWMLSGPRGWNRDVYDRSQLEDRG